MTSPAAAAPVELEPQIQRRRVLSVDAALWLVLMIVPVLIVPGLHDPLQLPKAAAFKFLVCATAFFVAVGNRLRRPEFPPAGIALALDLLGVALAASTLMATRPEAALAGAETLGCWALWTTLLVPVMSRRHFAKNAAFGIVAVGLLQMAIGSIQMAQANGLAASLRGTLGSAPECALFMGAAFLLTCYGHFELPRWRRAACATFCGLGVAVGGGWVLALALAATTALMSLRRGLTGLRRVLAIAAVAACAAGLAWMGTRGWGPAINALIESRGIGLGLGALETRFLTGRAPSALLQWLCEGGPLLVAAWVLLLASLARRAFERRHGQSTQPWAALTAFLALASLAHAAPRGVPGLLLFGVGTAGLIARRAPRGEAQPPALSWRRQALLGLILGCMIVSGRQIRLVGSSRFFARAQAAMEQGNPRRAAVLIDRALELNPASRELLTFRSRLWTPRAL